MPGVQVIGAQLAGQLAGESVSSAGGSFFTGIEQWGNYVCQNGLIPYEQGRNLHILGYTSQTQYNDFRRYQGMEGDNLDPQQFHVTFENQQGVATLSVNALQQELHINDRAGQIFNYNPSIQETLFLLNRRLITPELASFFVHNNVGGQSALVKSWLNARFEIPGPSDLIRFAVRDAFTPQAVSAFEYNKELPVDILPFMEMQGYGQVLPIPMPPNSTTTQGNDNRTHAQWFDLYWWSHWDLPSPTQGYTFLHRFYPDSPHGASPDHSPETEFTLTELELLLKTADYPPYWRKRLAAASYSPLTRVDSRRMFDMDVMNESQLYHSYRAIGYNNQNAQFLVDWNKKQKADKKAKKLTSLTLSEVYYLWYMEILDAANINLVLTQLGYKQPQITVILNDFFFRRLMNNLKRELKNTKQGFMDGLFNFDEALQALVTTGLSVVKSQAIIGEWEAERFVKRRYLSANQLMEMAVNGLISEKVFINRLSNLNFWKDEIDLMSKRVVNKIQQNMAKQLEKQAKEAQKIIEKQQAALLKPYTEANIKKFYKAKVMDLTDVITVLKMKGWKHNTIGQWIFVELKETVDLSDIEDETIEEQEDEEMNGHEMELN